MRAAQRELIERDLLLRAGTGSLHLVSSEQTHSGTRAFSNGEARHSQEVSPFDGSYWVERLRSSRSYVCWAPARHRSWERVRRLEAIW